MLWNRVSASAAACCRVLWQAGFEAYPVGGCVRDLLLDRVPGDWDVTTSACPEQVVSLFDCTIETGVKHGTVTVVLEKEHIEVTTFRGESGYSDGRHPDEVRFDATLEEDLSRRDFTINAMALDRDGGIVDLFGGQADLKAGVIRCVGDPVRRFGEDGLRMFRAVRFGAQLGFALNEEIKQAICACASGAKHIAAERVRVELEKTICSNRPEVAMDFFSHGLMFRWASGSLESLRRLRQVPDQPLFRWAALCACLLEGACIPSVDDFLRRLKLDGATIRACKAGWELYREGVPNDDMGWRRALASCGKEGCRAAAAMCAEETVLSKLEAVLECEPCVRVEQLALSGGDLVAMGVRGPRIGMVQRHLLEHVLDVPGDNRAEVLVVKAEEFLAR